LVAFSLALLLPIVGLAALALVYYASTERARSEAEAAQTAREYSTILDGDVRTLMSVLNGLAKSSLLRRKEFSDFHEQARRTVQGGLRQRKLHVHREDSLILDDQHAPGWLTTANIPVRPTLILLLRECLL
jgi:hypothetical protein